MTFIEIAGIVAAATVGDGIFALPFIFLAAGWLTGLWYLAVLAALVGTAHIFYLRTLEAEGEKVRLLGLAKKYFGAAGFWVGFLAIVIGLLLTLLAFLILGSQFIHLVVPVIPASYAFAAFWFVMSIAVVMSDREFRTLATAGIFCTTLIILFIFFSAWPHVFMTGLPAVRIENIFLPFGVVLFALAGWTSVEPAYEASRRRTRKGMVLTALFAGSFFAAILYAMFVAGIAGSLGGGVISPDTASGLTAWPIWKRDLVSLLGVMAVATVYLPISREIKNALEKDLAWPRGSSRPLIVLLPPVLALLGADNFIAIVSFVGGVFLSLQYLLIVSVARRALRLGTIARVALDLIGIVFVVATVYSVYQFIVR